MALKYRVIQFSIKMGRVILLGNRHLQVSTREEQVELLLEVCQVWVAWVVVEACRLVCLVLEAVVRHLIFLHICNR